MSHFSFNSCVRQHGESVAAYVARLRQVTEYCEYDISLEEMLRDRVVCGIQDERLQRRLQDEPDLPLRRHLTLCRPTNSPRAMLRLSVRISRRRYTVQRCPIGAAPHSRTLRATAVGACRHRATDCRFRDATCNHRGKKRHIARACSGRNTPAEHQPLQSGKLPRSTLQRANCFTQQAEEEPYTPFSVEYTMFQVSLDRVSPFCTSALINGATLHMEVDTDTALSLISEATYHRLWPKDVAPELQEVKINLRTNTGEKLVVLGSAQVRAQYKEQREDLCLLVVQGNGPSLLGRDWLAKTRLDRHELHLVQPSSALSLDAVIEKHETLLNNELEMIRGTTAKIHVDPEVRPRF